MLELSNREKRLLTILAALAGVLVLYFVIIYPFMSWRERISREYETNMSRLATLDRIYEQYREVKQRTALYQSQLNSTKGITSLIEENAQSLNILKNKSYTRDRPPISMGHYTKVSADVKFEGVDINSIINFLYKMENSGMPVQVSYCRINQTVRGRNTYDVTITFNSVTSQ